MLNKYEEGKLTQLQKLVSITAATAFPMLQVQHCGPELYAKVTVESDGNVVLVADDVDGATTTVLTADVSAAGYDTYGELVDAINATGVFRAYLIGALRSQSCNDTLAALSATSCRTDNGLTLYLDATVTAGVAGFAITNDKFIGRPSGGFTTQAKQRSGNELVENRLHYLDFLVTAAGNGTINVYSCDDVAGTETLMWSNAFASATAEQHGSTDPVDDFLMANLGCRLVVQAAKTTGTDDYTSPSITAIGSSKHIVGGDVRGGNYTGCA